MLEGAVDPPQQTSARHRAARLCGDSTLFGLRERAAARRPDKAALVSGERRLSDAEPQP
jgi:non-ribosomal peptide synthetase component E (peptide arylation enzyme)